MLIPDISAAVPRAIAPDALPTSVPIRQPIAGELGLKPGEVVQALVASSGEKMALQLGQHQFPLSSQMKLPEGQVAMRVIQAKEGLALCSATISTATGQSGAHNDRLIGSLGCDFDAQYGKAFDKESFRSSGT